MAMTQSERDDCHLIIHSHAVAAAAGNAVPVLGLGVAVDTITMTTMAMALASRFGGSITESVAKNMAVNAIKQTMLKQPIKTAVKEVTKIIPFLGQIIALDNSQESGHKIRNFFQNKQIQNHWGKENYLSSVVALNYKSLQYTQTAKILNQRTKNKYFD